MDQSQIAATPTAPISESRLASILKPKAADAKKRSPEETANRLRAAKEISHIFHLRDSEAFRWFESEFIEKPFRSSREKVLNEYTTEAELAVAKPIYVALKKVKAGVLEREIAHRTQLDPADGDLPRLRAELEGL